MLPLLFVADSAELIDDDRGNLDALGEGLKQISGRVTIVGYTAAVGTEESCIILSQQRAEAIANHLLQLGVRSADEITTQGMGSAQPVGDNNTPEGRQANRRTEITVVITEN